MVKRLKFRDRLHEEKFIIFDGAMGTELARRGLETGGELNLTAAEDVFDFHREYAAIGVDCLTTNTFTMNRIYLESHNLKTDFLLANRAGVELALRAKRPGQYVIGDLGPTGRLLQPYGEYLEEQFIDNYREQAEVLVQAGVDGLIIETMTDLREALCALQGCRKATALPVIVTMSFSTLDKGGRTIMGSSVTDIAHVLESNGADALGANCGDLTPLEMAELVIVFKQHTALPVLVQPNAGLPKLIEGKTVYDMSPADFASGVEHCCKNGALLVGGCCGTTIEHMNTLIKHLRPAG